MRSAVSSRAARPSFGSKTMNTGQATAVQPRPQTIAVVAMPRRRRNMFMRLSSRVICLAALMKTRQTDQSSRRGRNEPSPGVRFGELAQGFQADEKKASHVGGEE